MSKREVSLRFHIILMKKTLVDPSFRWDDDEGNKKTSRLLHLLRELRGSKKEIPALFTWRRNDGKFVSFVSLW